MNKITVGQFLAFTNGYVSIYIEDEFATVYKNKVIVGKPFDLIDKLKDKLDCPIDYIRNVDGGHRDDEKKENYAIVLGISDDNWEKYFKD